MAIRIGRYEFDGPYESPENLKNDPGVYAVIAVEDKRGQMIDVGESDDVKAQVDGHDRKQCWERLSNSRQLLYAAAYTHDTAEDGRHMMEKEIRTQFRVPCGKLQE